MLQFACIRSRGTSLLRPGDGKDDSDFLKLFAEGEVVCRLCARPWRQSNRNLSQRAGENTSWPHWLTFEGGPQVEVLLLGYAASPASNSP
jgi:hypothetical protein